ncbi:OmpA family protein [Algibacter sp. L1A34]|uniref:OmpA family protein n=1 Tax=Algibacter sp. L1A34 TaxID=2686365 RepID=UPI00131E387B|nr:OmpA family protein [Algibacter sp. L1A34]
MKKISLIVLLIIGSMSAKAQSYIGYLTDNYSGVNSVIANPANITDSRFKTDINLAGFSVFAGNDYYGVHLLDATKDGYDFDLDAKKSPTTDNNAMVNLDVMGPAFMFNLNKVSSIAVFTRARAMVNVDEINGETIDDLDNDDTTDFVVNEGDFNTFGHAWAELGVTYARVLMDNDQHFLKGGLTAKFLQGGGTANAYGRNVTVDYTELSETIETTGSITYGRGDDYDNDNYDYELPEAIGFGADLGFVYEWRPDYGDYKTTNVDGDTYSHKYENKYKLKLGLSITDIGKINYKDAISETFDVTNTVTEDDIDNEDDLNGILNNLYTLTNSSAGYKVNLPTALHLNVDYSLNRSFYVNLNTDLSLVSKGKENASRIANVVSLTPRFESKWFSFFVPVSVVQYNGFQAGAGFRAGPLYIGSGSVLTALTSDNSKGADVYAGLKVPVYQGKPKDKDGDGIIDKLDGCPKEAGPIENNGCPYLDSDVDGVMDNEDACPDIAGPKENKGCPWEDKDKDGVLDNKDACPNQAGPEENNGCPWADKDGDGVFDKDDECVNIAGTVANKGCPEVTVEIQKTLNAYAKTILFNSGKSTIKSESNQVLSDIIDILGQYPTAKFSVEGHTDSSGSDALNQRLSDSRANAVKTYLVENGVDAFRLSAMGYGESKPIASNETSKGRAENRRVEINLVK